MLFEYFLSGGLTSNTYITATGNIKFDPPVYEQRYSTAIRILQDSFWNTTFKKVVDFGCSEMKLLPLLRRIESIEHIIEVDCDETTLKTFQYRAVPLISDFLKKRANPLRVEIFCGSIDSPVENLRNVDAVLAIEVIEHLEPPIMENVPQNIFGFIQPKLVYITTPNSDFNILFGAPIHPNGFRHLDHKFEWSRKEFKSWAFNICKMYPNYKVRFMGVGRPPPDYKHLGCSTQVAIFARKDILEEPLAHKINIDIPATTDPILQYKLILASDFPHSYDKRTTYEKIFDEAVYQINSCRRVKRYINTEREIVQIPLNSIMQSIHPLGGTLAQLRGILLEKGYKIENDFVILPIEDDDDGRYGRFNDLYDDAGDYNPTPDEKDNPDELASGLTQTEAIYEPEENWD